MDVIVESTAIEDSKFEQNSQNDSFWDQESNNEQNPKNSKNKYIMRNNKMMRNQKYNQYISSDIVPILNKSKLDKTSNTYLTNVKEEYSTNLSQLAKKRNKIKMNLSGKTSMNTRSSYNIMNHPSSNKYLESGNYSSKSKDQLNITHEMKSPPLCNPDTRKSHDLPISKLKEKQRNKNSAKSNFMNLRNKSIPQSAMSESSPHQKCSKLKENKQKPSKVCTKSFYPTLSSNCCGSSNDIISRTNMYL